MTDTETASYLSHHLDLAGRSDTLFSDDATALIHQTSRGLPRAVNNLAVQALVAAYAANKTIVDESAPAPPSPKSPPNEHRRDNLTTSRDTTNTKAPPDHAAGPFHATSTSSRSMTPSSSSRAPFNSGLAWRRGLDLLGYALLLRARRSDSRFPTEAPGHPANLPWQ